MKNLGTMDVIFIKVEHDQLILQGSDRKIAIQMRPGMVSFFAERLHQWLNAREKELSDARDKLKGSSNDGA